MDAEILLKTLDKYNSFVHAGEDMQFGRAPEKLIAVKESLFYAVEICPNMLNPKVEQSAIRRAKCWM